MAEEITVDATSAPEKSAPEKEEPKKGHRHTWQGFRMGGTRIRRCAECGKTENVDDKEEEA